VWSSIGVAEPEYVPFPISSRVIDSGGWQNPELTHIWVEIATVVLLPIAFSVNETEIFHALRSNEISSRTNESTGVPAVSGSKLTPASAAETGIIENSNTNVANRLNESALCRMILTALFSEYIVLQGAFLHISRTES
jgi:hypothetical protein